MDFTDVYVVYYWRVKVEVKNKSGRVRINEYVVVSSDEPGAHRQAKKRIRGHLKAIKSCCIVNVAFAFYMKREGFPRLSNDELIELNHFINGNHKRTV